MADTYTKQLYFIMLQSHILFPFPEFTFDWNLFPLDSIRTAAHDLEASPHFM